MESKYQELLNRLLEINDLEMAGSVLGWDQTTYMPVGGAASPVDASWRPWAAWPRKN